MNSDCHISLAAPQQSLTDYFYKNADADEMIFVHEGSGKLLTQYGQNSFAYGDYLVIPRGTIYQLQFNDTNNRLLIVESFSPIRYPKRYVSKYGQLLENSPFCERDIRRPEQLITNDEAGDFLIKTKKKGILYGLHYAHHPFDVIGWDGCCTPSLSAYTILNLLPAAYISHHRFTRHSKGIILWSAVFARVYMITTRMRSLRPITTVILIVMNCCIMWMAIL